MGMELSPAAESEWLRLAAEEYARLKFATIDIDELNTLDISTISGFLGIPINRVARELPVIECGPRSRRIRISDYKAYLAKRTKAPKASARA